MAIDTTNELIALMESEVWEPGIPMVSTSTLDQADLQQLLWEYPGILWASGTVLAYIHDLNTRLRVFLEASYSLTAPQDLTTQTTRYTKALATGDANQRFRQLIDDATP